jgi:hypothetical protein
VETWTVKVQSHFALSPRRYELNVPVEAPPLDVCSKADGISATGGSAFG